MPLWHRAAAIDDLASMTNKNCSNLTESDSSKDAVGPSKAMAVDVRDLQAMDDLVSEIDPVVQSLQCEEVDPLNQLSQVRLGIASGLFVALKMRHPPTAEHSLRVAMGCSAWAMAAKLSAPDRDLIEVCALLHDIGKIGVSDSILKSPGKLTHDEYIAMRMSRYCGREILRSFCKSDTIPNVVEHTHAWFDGSHCDFQRAGKDIPLLARMIAVVDAFDSMTTEQLYRPAAPRERAIAELFDSSGKQFDPTLVGQFAELHSSDVYEAVSQSVSQRWLTELVSSAANEFWERSRQFYDSMEDLPGGNLYFERLWNTMHDGLFFVDADACILNWNHGAERMTGLKRDSMRQRIWSTDIVRLQQLDGIRITNDDCPIRHVLKTGTLYLRRVLIRSADGGETTVDLQVAPVIDSNGTFCGATVLIRDASSEALLEERVETLYQKATMDPLTGVANRAEFDRGLSEAVRIHLRDMQPCSLIICDVDHFKKVNDVHGHQSGDEALISFAALLQRSCRQGDLASRYGGEEFVIICHQCGASEATTLAEDIRQQLEWLPLSWLGHKHITASFGVTELQPGDTAETMLRRADRALLRAKDTGRNRVIQLGSGIDHAESDTKDSWWSAWLKPTTTQSLLDCTLVTNIPLNLVVQKLRGFVSDHEAEIVRSDEQQIIMRIDGWPSHRHRRQQDRPIRLVLQLDFRKSTDNASETKTGGTRVHAVVKPVRNRDRRQKPMDAARGLISSLKAYLMAHIVNDKASS